MSKASFLHKDELKSNAKRFPPKHMMFFRNPIKSSLCEHDANSWDPTLLKEKDSPNIAASHSIVSDCSPPKLLAILHNSSVVLLKQVTPGPERRLPHRFFGRGGGSIPARCPIHVLRGDLIFICLGIYNIRRPLATARGARERRYEFSWCGWFELI